MLLAKLKELKAQQEQEEAGGAGGDGPAAPNTLLALASSASASSSGPAGALGGWGKTRVAGTKAARQAIRDNRGLQTEPDGVIRRLKGHVGPVHCLALSPVSVDGQRRLYSGGKDGSVRAWDHLGEGGKCVLVMAGHKAPYAAAVCALAVDPGGKRLYSAGADNTVRVWMLTDGSCLRSTNLFEMTHEDANSYFVAPQRAYSHSFAAQQHKVYGMSLSHDAARCFAGCSDKDIKVWDTKTGTLKLALKGHEGPVGAMAAFHTSSTRLLTGSGDATLRAWDLARNRQVWRGNDSELLCSLKGHTDWVSDIVINDDNNILCSASHDGSILVWRVGRVVRKELVFSEAANVFLDLRK